MEETDIREIALDNPDISQRVGEILKQIDEQEENVVEKVEEKVEKVEKVEKAEADEEEPINSLPEEVPAKKVARPKGRPKGALNKAPAKPRAKKKIKEESVEEERGVEFEVPWEEVPRDCRRRICDSDLATQMFRLLRQQENVRANRKRQLYASWFQ